jgi:hypothetical protein
VLGSSSCFVHVSSQHGAQHSSVQHGLLFHGQSHPLRCKADHQPGPPTNAPTNAQRTTHRPKPNHKPPPRNHQHTNHSARLTTPPYTPPHTQSSKLTTSATNLPAWLSAHPFRCDGVATALRVVRPHLHQPTSSFSCTVAVPVIHAAVVLLVVPSTNNDLLKSLSKAKQEVNTILC